MPFPNLIDEHYSYDEKTGAYRCLAQVLPNKRRDNIHIPFDILLCLAVAAKLKCKTKPYRCPFCSDESRTAG